MYITVDVCRMTVNRADVDTKGWLKICNLWVIWKMLSDVCEYDDKNDVRSF